VIVDAIIRGGRLANCGPFRRGPLLRQLDGNRPADAAEAGATCGDSWGVGCAGQYLTGGVDASLFDTGILMVGAAFEQREIHVCKFGPSGLSRGQCPPECGFPLNAELQKLEWFE
jgi:hypothetical protein